MAPRKIEVATEYPGLGQIIADKMVTELIGLISRHAFLEEDGDLIKIKAMLFKKSHQPNIGIEELRKNYEKNLLPRLREIQAGMTDGRIVVIEGQRKIIKPLQLKTFEEIKGIVIRELEQEVPKDAELSAVDSIIAGDIKLSDVFLPFQRKIREMVLEVLDDTVDIDEDARKRIEAVGKSIVFETCEEEIFDILYLKNEEIESAVAEGRLDRAIADAITSARSDIDKLIGKSMFNKARRLKAIKMAYLGVIDKDRFTEKIGGVNQRDLNMLRRTLSAPKCPPTGAGLTPREEKVLSKKEKPQPRTKSGKR